LFYAPLPEGKQNDRRHFMQQRTYTVDSENDRKTWRLFTPSNSIITNKTVTDLCGQERLEVVTSSSIYLEIFGKAIVSSSANISGTKSPKQFSDITDDIINNADYIVNLRKKERRENSSSIIKIEKNGSIIKLR